ncbi:hypothetical protein, partial [Xenorhabdus bovienii]|uniref:hypothetical protein n=1 Tax=Xenorhabdus bovienii TaxID=40576 RepID=UPI0023B2DDA9
MLNKKKLPTVSIPIGFQDAARRQGNDKFVGNEFAQPTKLQLERRQVYISQESPYNKGLLDSVVLLFCCGL